jgi:hypothetical protein
MHTALVSRLLRDKSLWEVTTEVEKPTHRTENLALEPVPGQA